MTIQNIAPMGERVVSPGYPAPAAASPYPPEPRRELPSLARRILIIGLDGATFDILDPLMAAGRMPNLKGLIETGASGILYSTKPPITPAAWTTFMTGKGPGRHGIVDFEKYDVRTNRLSFNSTYEIRVGRSASVTGPYLDRAGKDLCAEGGSGFLGTEGRLVGPGHAGVFREGQHTWLSCHFYDGKRGGMATLAVRRLEWDADGWPVAGAVLSPAAD